MTTGPFSTYAEPLAALGYAPLPLNGKRPLLNDWQRPRPEQLSTLVYTHPTANVGIATSGLTACDADIPDRELARHMLRFVAETLGVPVADLLIRIGRAPRWLLLLRAAEGELPKRASAMYEDGQGRRHRLEWLRHGQQFLAFGAHPDTGRDMAWPHGDPLSSNTRAEQLPAITEQQIDAINAEFAAQCEARGWRLVSRSNQAADPDAAPATPVAGVTPEIAEDALRHYANDDLHYDEWLAVGMALHHQFQGDLEGFDLWDNWSQTSAKYGGPEYNWRRWESFDHERPGGISLRSVLREAEASGWTRPPGVEQAPAAADDFPELEPYAEAAPLDADAFKHDPQTDAGDKEPDPYGLIPGLWHIDPELDPSKLARRKWIVPGRLIAGHVALLVGPPGVSKSMFDLTWAVSIATGRNLLGIAPTRSGHVLIVNNEDPLDEIEKRIAAICALHAIPLGEVYDRLHICSGYERAYKLAELDERRGVLRPTKDATRIVEFAKGVGVVAMFVDPLISTVRGGEENSNDRMEELVAVYKAIASKTGAAVSITHHTRKSGRDSEAHAGDMESARGAGALIGSVRNAHTLAGMSAATGEKLGLPREVSDRLVRLDSAKQNYWVRDTRARWFELVSVPIGNGEEVGVPRPVELDEMQKQYANPDDLTVEVLDLHVRRERLVGLFADAIADGECAWPLANVAERWTGFADCSMRTAQDAIKRMVPEGGMHHGVLVGYHGIEHRLWRECQGEGRGARHTIYIIREQGCNEPGEDEWLL